MKHKLLLPIFLFLSFIARSQEKILDARIWLDGRTMQDLVVAGLEADHGFYEPGVYFRSEFSSLELIRVKKAGFRIDTFETDVQARYLRENARRQPVRTVAAADRSQSPCEDFGSASAETPVNYTYGSMGGYYTYEEYLAILDDMHAKFPHLISERKPVHESLLTHEGRPQWFVRISDNPNTDETGEAEALYTAIHHAREPNSLTHLIYFMWHLLENYDRDPDLRYLLNQTELYFIPCLNPDGYIYNQTTNPDGGGFWRKNRRDNGDGTFGVDLNRNYGYNWGVGNGSSPTTSSEVYRGPAAFSEPETQMARAFIEAHNFEVVLNCHTSGNKMVHPWGYENSVPTPDFTTLAEWLTRESGYLHGSCWQTLGYLACGTSDDWMYGEKDRLAYTPETGTSFWPFIDQIDGNNKSMFQTNLSAAWYALGGAVIRHLPGASLNGNVLQAPFKVRQYEIGTAPVQISFEALSNNIASFAPVANLTIEDFESSSFVALINLSGTLQPGEEVRFVARAERQGQIHADTVVWEFQPSPYVVAVEDDLESGSGIWSPNTFWGATTEYAFSPGKSMTDSPNDVYTEMENFLITKDKVAIPPDATEARLRFFALWDIDPGLDWAQVLVKTDLNAVEEPLQGSLTTYNSNLAQYVYEGTHLYWEEECMDLGAYLGQKFYLIFSMISFSGNPDGRDGFYFDDLVLEYRTESGVHTIELHPECQVSAQPNPASGQTRLHWSGEQGVGHQLDIVDASGKILQQIALPEDSGAYTLQTAGWPAGVYWYRLYSDRGVSAWKKLVVF